MSQLFSEKRRNLPSKSVIPQWWWGEAPFLTTEKGSIPNQFKEGSIPINCDHLIFNTDASSMVLAHQGKFCLTLTRPTKLQGFK